MKVMWVVWNADRAKPIGSPMKSLRKALANAMALECRDGEHITVVPA